MQVRQIGAPVPLARSRRPFLGGIGALLLTGGAARAAAAAPLRIGALRGPYEAVLDYTRTLAAKRALAIEIVESQDPAALRQAVADGILHAAACENPRTAERGDGASLHRLVPAFATVTLPIGIYSRQIHAVTQLRRGDRIVLPSNLVERDRARVLLYNYGLLRAHEDGGLAADFSNLVNPIGFQLEEAAPEDLPRHLGDARAVLMPYQVAVDARLRPAVDSIGLEDGKSPYTGMLLVRAADQHAEWVGRLKRLLQSREVRQFIYERYGDSVEPPW
jgi:D-methionine transport system substrate-binding protein